jgi:hypothetical protein
MTTSIQGFALNSSPGYAAAPQVLVWEHVLGVSCLAALSLEDGFYPRLAAHRWYSVPAIGQRKGS